MMRRRYRAVITVAAVLASFGAQISVYGATAVERHGKLRTDGPYIINESNKIVQLRGMSFYWSTAGWGDGLSYYNDQTVNAMVDDWGCTVLRAAYDRNEGNNNGWQQVQTVIDACIRKGIYVIIDWHSHTAEAQASQAIQFFKEQAQKYKNTPNVIFEPYNEPINGSGGTKDGTQPAAKETWKKIKPYLQDVTQAIRDAGADNLVLIGTPYYCQYVNVAANDQLKDKSGNKFSNIAYVFHFYAASHGPEAYYVKGGDEGGMESEYLQGALGKVPIFVSEWGTTHSDGGQDGHTYVDEENTNWWFDRYLNSKYRVSHCNWSLCTHEPSSALSGGTSPSASGRIVQKLLKESTDEYAREEDAGKDGPAAGTTASTPGTQPAHQYMKYYGANMNLIKPVVPFLFRDKDDKRTANDSCIPVLGTAAGEDWVSYDVNNSKATKYIYIRSRPAKPGSEGKIDVLIDGNSAGSVDVKDTGWYSYDLAADVATGKHTVKLVFTTTKGDGFLVEWLELAEDKVGIAGGCSRRTASVTRAAVTVASFKNGIHLSIPSDAGYTGYRLFKADGRAVRSGTVSSSLVLGGLAEGVWFIELSGSAGRKVLNTMVFSR